MLGLGRSSCLLQSMHQRGWEYERLGMSAFDMFVGSVSFSEVLVRVSIKALLA
jgi:hypothetical protein